MAVETSTDVEEIQRVRTPDDNTAIPANGVATQTIQKDVNIDETGVNATLQLEGRSRLDVVLSSSGDPADYRPDVSANGDFWFEGVEQFDSATEITDSYLVGVRYVRLRVKTSANNGTTATVCRAGS